MNLYKLGVLITIIASFIGAANGYPFAAVEFWVTLFAAAITNRADSMNAKNHRQLM